MKKTRLMYAVLMLCCIVAIQSCVEDKCEEKHTYIEYVPITASIDSLRNLEINAEAPRNLENTGKLYFYNDYVFVNEIKEGIHVINNKNPKKPVVESFIPLKGSVDMVVKGNILYADFYRDLVALNISDPNAPTLVSREKDVFDHNYPYYYKDSTLIIIDYEEHERTIDIDCSEGYLEKYYDGVVVPTSNNGGVPQKQQGIAGSMARFGLHQNYLYAIDGIELDVFNISNPSAVQSLNSVIVDWGIETIFPHGNHLFLGASDGMYIFDNSDPVAPVQQSKFRHATACDPVYVSGNRAYVTLRSGNRCNNVMNQLDIVDITDLNNPSLVKSYEMRHPHGLSVTPNKKIFLCEGEHGLRILDVNDEESVEVLGDKGGFDAYDAIALGEHHVMIIGKDGFYQFDTTDPENIVELSKIEVQK